MADPVITSAAKSASPSMLNWLLKNLPWPGPLRFYNPKITYCYSRYDNEGNHVRDGGTPMIYEVACQITVYNPYSDPTFVHDLQILVKVDAKLIPLLLYDEQLKAWRNHYNLSHSEGIGYSWHGYAKGCGKTQHDPPMLPLPAEKENIAFYLQYRAGIGWKRRLRIKNLERRERIFRDSPTLQNMP